MTTSGHREKVLREQGGWSNITRAGRRTVEAKGPLAQITQRKVQFWTPPATAGADFSLQNTPDA